MASITLPRPSQKGNLANVVAPIPVKETSGPQLPNKEGEREKEK
jgi:hypothetical protein